jgi:hypothetical protein
MPSGAPRRIKISLPKRFIKNTRNLLPHLAPKSGGEGEVRKKFCRAGKIHPQPIPGFIMKTTLGMFRAVG